MLHSGTIQCGTLLRLNQAMVTLLMLQIDQIDAEPSILLNILFNICKLLFQIDFLNIASISMLKQPDFYDKNDESRIHMIKAVKNLKSLDPEFVLKVRKSGRYCHSFVVLLSKVHINLLMQFLNCSIWQPGHLLRKFY